MESGINKQQPVSRPSKIDEIMEYTHCGWKRLGWGLLFAIVTFIIMIMIYATGAFGFETVIVVSLVAGLIGGALLLVGFPKKYQKNCGE